MMLQITITPYFKQFSFLARFLVTPLIIRKLKRQDIKFKGKEEKMLETIIVILLVLWLIGVFGFSGSYFIHILLLLMFNIKG
jgi:hypothetical protein